MSINPDICPSPLGWTRGGCLVVFMAISIREHCIAAYDELSRLRRVEPIPAELDGMEEKTAGGIVKKIKAVIDSPYFRGLPDSKTIQSGANSNFIWKKAEAEVEATRIWNDCKNYL